MGVWVGGCARACVCLGVCVCKCVEKATEKEVYDRELMLKISYDLSLKGKGRGGVSGRRGRGQRKKREGPFFTACVDISTTTGTTEA